MADTLSQLSLGIREVFRILIPGVYALALIEWLAPYSSVAGSASAAVYKELIAAFFLGVLGYGLRVHEKWFPFNIVFEQWRGRLNDELGGGQDHVPTYKYFLETSALAVKDRIHYFSSFYYMLAELSLFSTVAGVALLLRMFDFLGCLSTAVVLLLIFGLGVQLSALCFPVPSDRSKRLDWFLQRCPAGFVALGLIWACTDCELKGKIWPRVPLMAVDWRVLCLLVAAVVFGMLGSRQWELIIRLVWEICG
jgi:hypothetical protein